MLHALLLRNLLLLSSTQHPAASCLAAFLLLLVPVFLPFFLHTLLFNVLLVPAPLLLVLLPLNLLSLNRLLLKGTVSRDFRPFFA